MKNTYFDLIEQTYYFPQDGFDLVDGYLTFHGLSLKYLIDKYGTPLKIIYLPKIGKQIKLAKNWFNLSLKKHQYKGRYYNCYCTKSNHFSYVLNEVLEHGAHLETSSSYDIDLVLKLHEMGKLTKGTIIINNGYKQQRYVEKIADLINDGFYNVIPVCDNKDEVDEYVKLVKKPCNLGIRIATDEEPQFDFYTSRLGVPRSEIISFYEEKIKPVPNLKLKLLHFFVNTGIKDTMYYWGELKRFIEIYCELKKICPSLKGIDIGGGLPVRNSLAFDYDYPYMIDEIIRLIKEACTEEGIDEPDIFTEFGKFTVGESSAVIFSVLGEKQQNESEIWYMLDNSLMNTLPDAWGIAERFILLPINHWDKEFTKVNIGGITCDGSDYYNSEANQNLVYLPRIEEGGEPLYLGFFHTGAYQDSISGYGGIKHCLLPSPKIVLVDRNKKGDYVDTLFKGEQEVEHMLDILGY